MEVAMLDRIRDSLLEKRTTLADWLRGAPPRMRRVRVGPAGEEAVQRHVEVIEEALERAAGGTLGECQVCHGSVEPELLEMDYTASVCLDHLSGEQRRLLEEDLELSQTVQRALLPQQIPSIPGVELAAFSRPAQIVGGDYFDFLRFRDGSYGLAIADVAGKGMAASLLMASLQTLLRALAPESDSTAEVVERLNRLFCHNIHFTTFVTLFLGRLDPATHVLDYCNAGHNPPILFRPGSGENSISWLRPTGPAIALTEGARLDAETLALSPGDTLLLYTDGVTEACDSQKNLFGYERLAAFVQERVDLPVNELTRALRQTLDAYCEGQPLDDDTTIVVCKIVNA